MTERIVWIRGVPVGTSLVKIKIMLSEILKITTPPIKVEFLNKCSKNSFSSPVLNTISVKLNQKDAEILVKLNEKEIKLGNKCIKIFFEYPHTMNETKREKDKKDNEFKTENDSEDLNEIRKAEFEQEQQESLFCNGIPTNRLDVLKVIEIFKKYGTKSVHIRSLNGVYPLLIEFTSHQDVKSAMSQKIFQLPDFPEDIKCEWNKVEGPFENGIVNKFKQSDIFTENTQLQECVLQKLIRWLMYPIQLLQTFLSFEPVTSSSRLPVDSSALVLTSQQTHFLEYTLWFDRFKEKYSNKLTITLNNERRVVTLELNQSTKQETAEDNDLQLLTSFKELNQFIKNVGSRTIENNLTEIDKDYIMFCLKSETRTKNFYKAYENYICFERAQTEELKAICDVSSDIENTLKTVSKLIKSKSVTVNYEEVTNNNKEWQKLKKDLNEEGVYLAINKDPEPKELVFTCLKDIDEVEKRIVSCLQGFECFKFNLECSPVKLEYALKYFNQSLNFYSLRRVNIDKVEIETQYFNINKAKKDFLNSINKLIVSRELIENKFMKQFLCSKEGGVFLKRLQENNRASILLSNRLSTKTKPKPKLKQNSIGEELCPNGELKYDGYLKSRNQVLVKVIKGNIVDFEGKIIVNPTNKDLILLGGGVSGAINIKAEKSVQQEMNLKKKIIGQLHEGSSVVTKSGNLACRNIIHTCGPNWNILGKKQSSMYLKNCVYSLLKEAEKLELESIAIPLISSGVFGGDPKICSKIICETMSDYFEKATDSYITQVVLIEFSSEKVISCWVRNIKQVCCENDNLKSLTSVEPSNQIGQQIDNNEPNSGMFKGIVNLRNNVCKKMFSKISTPKETFNFNNTVVNLIPGDITNQKVDVICISNHNFTGHLLDHTIKSGGLQIRKELVAAKNRYRDANVILTSGGSLPCKYIIHLNLTRDIHAGKHTVTESFHQIISMGAKKIAIPAFGASRWTSDQVAKLTVESLRAITNISINIEEVYITIYETRFFDPFKKELEQNQTINTSLQASSSSKWKVSNNRKNTYESESKTSLRSGYRKTNNNVKRKFIDMFEIGDATIELINEDITAKKCDAICISNLNFTGPLLNHTIKRGGLQIRKELEAAINRNPGANVILTSGGSLPCRYIIHLNLMRDIHAGKKVIIEAFKELTKLNCKTVCIPAFGGSRWTHSEVVKTTIESLTSSFKHGFLIKVYVSLFEQKFFQPFRKELARHKNKTTIQSFKEEAVKKYEKSNKLCPEKNTVDQPPLEVLFCTEDQHLTDNAIKEMFLYESSNLKKVELTNTLFQSYYDSNKDALTKIENLNTVDIEFDLNKNKACISGFKENVNEAKNYVQEGLHKFDKEIINAKFVQWYKMDLKNNWKKVDLNLNLVLENNYEATKNKTETSLQKEYLIDFKNMKIKKENDICWFKIKRQLTGLSEARDEENKEIQGYMNDIVCKICLTDKTKILFQPCGHFCCCLECAYKVNECPICRSSITQRIRAYA